MTWTEKLEYAVKRDAETQEEGLKNFISEENELLERIARKLTFAVHDRGFVIAREIFSQYWVNMSSTVGLNDDVSGYYTTLDLDRETTTPFHYGFYTIVTASGIICRSTSTAQKEGGMGGSDNYTQKVRKEMFSLTIDQARSMDNEQNIREFVDKVMLDYSDSYMAFLKGIKNIE
jgi:hypothetical protein